jgi:hypothetical protein
MGKDLTAAMSAIEREPDPTTRHAALREAIGIWFLLQPLAAAEYVAKQGDASLIPEISGTTYAERSTQQEADHLLSILPEGKGRDDFTREVATFEIRRGQFTRAVDLLNKTSDSLQRDDQLSYLGSTWTEDHPQTLAPWLRHQPESPDRDLVTLGMVTQLASNNPRGALPWLSFITDPSVRLAATKNLAHHWLKLEPAAGQVWLTQSSGLPPAHQTKVLENSMKYNVDYIKDDYLSTRWPPQ